MSFRPVLSSSLGRSVGREEEEEEEKRREEKRKKERNKKREKEKKVNGKEEETDFTVPSIFTSSTPCFHSVTYSYRPIKSRKNVCICQHM